MGTVPSKSNGGNSKDILKGRRGVFWGWSRRLGTEQLEEEPLSCPRRLRVF